MHPIYDRLTPALTRDKTDTVYYIEDVLWALPSILQRKEFAKWLKGRTVMVVNDRGAIYQSELEKFFR